MDRYRVAKNKRVDLIGSLGDFVAEKKQLSAFAIKLQQIKNDFMMAWLRLHFEAGNHLIVREWVAADQLWLYEPEKRNGLPRKRCPIDPCSPDMLQRLNGLVAEVHPEVNSPHIQLALKKALDRFIHSSGIRSAYPRWIVVLCGKGELPQSSSKSHIALYSKDCRFIAPQNDEDDWKIEIDLNDSLLTFKIKTKYYKLHSIRDMLWKIAAKEWDVKGVDLQEIDGKWYAHVCHSIPKVKVQFDSSKTAFLAAGFYKPLLFRINGRTNRRLRYGDDIKYTRKSLTIQSLYKNAPKKGKRGITISRREKLARRWRDFCKTWSRHVADDIVRRLLGAGIGRIVVFQPVGDSAYDRQISKLGRVIGCDIDSTKWDWVQTASLIQKACNKVNIEVIVRQVGDSGSKMRKVG